MQNKGKYILWSHLRLLLEEARSDTGLYVGKCLQQQHVSLNSFSRMRVDLAAQVNKARHEIHTSVYTCTYIYVFLITTHSL